jgi:hypothetical protein
MRLMMILLETHRNGKMNYGTSSYDRSRSGKLMRKEIYTLMLPFFYALSLGLLLITLIILAFLGSFRKVFSLDLSCGFLRLYIHDFSHRWKTLIS